MDEEQVTGVPFGPYERAGRNCYNGLMWIIRTVAFGLAFALALGSIAEADLGYPSLA